MRLLRFIVFTKVSKISTYQIDSRFLIFWAFKDFFKYFIEVFIFKLVLKASKIYREFREFWKLF